MSAVIREDGAVYLTRSSYSRGVDGACETGGRWCPHRDRYAAHAPDRERMSDATEKRPTLRRTPMAASLARCRQSSLTQRKFVASFA